jgi:hypothetical protein
VTTQPLPEELLVSVPAEAVASGKGFSVSLPSTLLAITAGQDVRVSRANGKRLPSWLRYVKGTKSFMASAVPAGALPMKVLVRAGTQSWTMQITDRPIN